MDTLSVTLSDNSAALAETQQCVSQLRRLIADSEADRRLLQDRLATTRSVCLSVCLSLSLSLSLSFCFNGHFPGEPGLAGVY